MSAAEPSAAVPPAISEIVTAAIEQRVLPGAVVLVANRTDTLYAAAYGNTMYDNPGSQPVTLATLYDIASLTKMFTATAALRLFDERRLELDTPVTHYLPDFRAASVTVRHLLTHTSGLHLRLSSLRHLPPAEIRSAIYAIEPVEPPGTHTAYVNINSLLLGDVVAAVAGQPLNQYISQVILQPLAMHHSWFCPPDHLHAAIAPTEWDTEWRDRLIQGSVHDESAYALGGVAGHAGLFSTAADLQRFGQMWLNGGELHSTRLLQPETVALATRYQAPWLRLHAEQQAICCGLGWMLDRAEVMGSAPPGSYGHTGFTGPVLVVVPRQQLVLVVLCNRTYPRRTAQRTHFPVIAALVDAVLQQVGASASQ